MIKRAVKRQSITGEIPPIAVLFSAGLVMGGPDFGYGCAVINRFGFECHARAIGRRQQFAQAGLLHDHIVGFAVFYQAVQKAARRQ